MSAAKKAPRGAAPTTDDRPGAIVRIPFHGDELEAVREGERVAVPIRRVCDLLGLYTTGQLAKLRSKPWATIQMICTVAEDGKARDVACIDLDALPMWLATIELRRVKPELHDKLVVYQREAARAVRDHFLGPRPVVVPPPSPPKLRALPAPRNAALRRLDTAERVLEYVEQDLGVYVRLDPSVRHKFYEAIHTGLVWSAQAIQGVEYARGEPRMAERIEAARAIWRRLNASFEPGRATLRAV